jgi:hypothetical protein
MPYENIENLRELLKNAHREFEPRSFKKLLGLLSPKSAVQAKSMPPADKKEAA